MKSVDQNMPWLKGVVVSILISWCCDAAGKSVLRDPEEIACETLPPEIQLRNGLGDDSFYIWSDKRIPFVIGEGFNDTQRTNIQEAISDYNNIFKGCLKWIPKTDEAVYVHFLNSGSCYSRVGRAFWPFPLSQEIFLGRCSHLIGHIKHEMMHTLGFYHEHSRSDRDQYIKINWNNIEDGHKDQFLTFRWTTGFGEPYDYDSIMHYSSKAFSRDALDENITTIEPISNTADRKATIMNGLGRKANLSETDIRKIKKMYKCSPFENWDNGCSSDNDCGLNEHCALSINLVRGQCRTLLRDGSYCVRNEECLSRLCSGGVCTSCIQDAHCPNGHYCSNKYLPLVEKACTNFCGQLCFLSASCGGQCPTCNWAFTCT